MTTKKKDPLKEEHAQKIAYLAQSTFDALQKTLKEAGINTPLHTITLATGESGDPCEPWPCGPLPACYHDGTLCIRPTP
jgi:hypothetical protein